MKNTVLTFQQAKENGEKLTMLTAYDYSTAKLIDEAGVNSILVGDSLGNVILGYEDTISVTMEDMIHHGAAVARGAKNALVVIDMPFMSYQTSVYDALVNAGRLMKEGRGDAVKLEGGVEVCPQRAFEDPSCQIRRRIFRCRPARANRFCARNFRRILRYGVRQSRACRFYLCPQIWLQYGLQPRKLK